MQYRRLGRTHMMAAEVGLGLRSLERLPAAAAAEVIRAAALVGSNVVEVDTGSPAQLAALALALKPLRSQLLVVGVGATNRESVEAAMATLGLDYFDAYLANAPGADLGEVQSLALAGVAKAVGVATSEMSEALSAILDGGVEIVQVPFNLLELRQPTGVDAVFAAAHAADVGVLACSPLAGGRLAHGDAAVRDALEFLLDGRPRSVAQAALGWALTDLRVSAVVAGPASEEHVYENAGASYLAPLDDGTLAAIARAMTGD